MSYTVDDTVLGAAKRQLLPDPLAQINCPWKGYSTLAAQRCKDLTGVCSPCAPGQRLRAGVPDGGKVPVLVPLNSSPGDRLRTAFHTKPVPEVRDAIGRLADYLSETPEESDARAAAAAAPPVLLARKLRAPPRSPPAPAPGAAPAARKLRVPRRELP